MDRRQQKTRDAVFDALTALLGKKRYEEITVQEIIEEAGIGRSTFYAHFETKDEMLRAMCTDLFNHVFTESRPEAFRQDRDRLQQKLTGILHHLKEDSHQLKGILKSDSGEVFMRFFREYLNVLFRKHLCEFRRDVPADYLLHHLTGSFAETVKWWMEEDTRHTPEEVAGYFMAVIRPQRHEKQTTLAFEF